ncbi:ribonuclease H [Senna tora]|uniref:Ribonuclease H n=1 Tax=Senna tora TaxID=362788 RepID=A0A834SXR9_9FABA|nr:ribonuclease H [Senna tora]
MCRSKQNGRLGLRHIKEDNKVVMVKLGWGLMEKKDTLWARVLRAMYKCSNDLVPAISKPQNSSRLWKVIANSWKHVEEGTIWRIGDGRRARKRRGLTECDSSTRCKTYSESLIHMLRDCLCIKPIWLKLSTRRNEVVFNDHVNMAEDPIVAIKQLVHVYKQAYAKRLVHNSSNPVKTSRLICWKPLGAWWLKFNVDATVKDSLGIASCGGVLWDYAGNFVKGFVRKLGSCDMLLAKLWAILNALEVAWSMGYRNLVVELDSLMAINLLKNQIRDNHPYAAIICRIQHWVAVDWDVSFLHCFREGNFVADAVAGMACNAFSAGLSLLHSVPAGWEPILRRDAAGVGVARCSVV